MMGLGRAAQREIWKETCRSSHHDGVILDVVAGEHFVPFRGHEKCRMCLLSGDSVVDAILELSFGNAICDQDPFFEE